MSSNSSNVSLTRNASASRCDAVDDHPVQQNSQSAGAYVVPWKRCTLCWPSDSSGPFRSPRDFCRHLRDCHCTREGGSFVCRYGMNGVCPSLPVEGVSDRDYEDHVARDHVAGESCVSSQAPTTLHSSALPYTHRIYQFSLWSQFCLDGIQFRLDGTVINYFVIPSGIDMDHGCICVCINRILDCLAMVNWLNVSALALHVIDCRFNPRIVHNFAFVICALRTNMHKWF